MLRDPRYIPVVRDKLPNLMSIGARGQFGYSGGLGRIALGYTRLGFYCPYSGIYETKPRAGGRITYLKKFYRPTNPQTETQQAWRAVLTAGWAEWATYDPETKEQYRLRGIRRQMSGANLFMSEWLKSHS